MMSNTKLQRFYMFDLSKPVEGITLKRKEISRLLIMESSDIKSSTITAMCPADLDKLFHMYDGIFFDNWFRDNFRGKLKVSLSRKMTKSAGLTLCPKNMHKIKPEELTLEIRIGVDFFFRYGYVKGGNSVCGINTGSSLEALQLVFEHEICHVIEFIAFGKSSCKGKWFRTAANQLFGHTESSHRLPTQRQIAKIELGLNIGDPVSFIYENRNLSGIIYNINKRATVMVRDKKGHLVDRQGNRYSKYYVPLEGLRLQC